MAAGTVGLLYLSVNVNGFFSFYPLGLISTIVIGVAKGVSPNRLGYIFHAIKQYREDSVFDLGATPSSGSGFGDSKRSISPELLSILADPGDKGPVELLSDERGRCAGAVLYNLEWRCFVLVRARAVLLATGGAGRLHLNRFPTSNHYGATADGLVVAYRFGARLRELDSFQYHPTGIAYPPHLAGALVSEAARSAGARLINGEGHRFIDELAPRDVVAAAILRECAEGRGIEREGQLGVFLDTPTLALQHPGILEERLVTLRHLAKKCGHDPAREPFLVYPTLHYQNGGVAIDKVGAASVPGLYCVGELSGGLHGCNRLMGNALLDILSMGRRAGASAAQSAGRFIAGRAGIGHVHAWQRELMLAGLPLQRKAPQLFPTYAHFDLSADVQLASKTAARRVGGPR